MNISPAAPNLDFRFCHFYAASGRYHLFARYDVACGCVESPDSAVYLNLQDCTLRGGRINLGNPDYFYLYDDDYVYAPGAVSWTNNTFDNVNINLDPTYYEYGWDDLGLNVNLSFAAYNNLFRGSLWFHLEPIPASAGNWMLQDNLFDKVDIVQDLNIAPINQPLDYDYNGYWPLSASALNWDAYFIPPWGTEEYWGFAYCAIANTSQLQPTTTGDGFTDGGHEVVLTAPPPYQTSFFGNYYLPINTPLYGAGSTTAGALGLYHYTTRIDQVKEGDEPAGHKVNIGVHYVAASVAQPLGGPLPRTGGSSPVYSLTDSDGDGIPDYVEDANGNGVVDANETDWNNPMSDGVTPDAYSTNYDDVDLDGDGLTGLAEKFFGTNPLIPDNPLNLPTALQQSPLSGVITIPLNISTNVDTNSAFTFYVDGVEANATIYQTNGNWFAEWDTMTVQNGPYPISLGLTYDMAGSQVFGCSQFVTVANAITLDEDTRWFTDQLTIDANVNVDASEYRIEVYDAETQEHLQTLSGDIANGTIETSWNLQDDGGNRIVNGPLRCDFYLTSPQLSAKASVSSVSPNDAPSGSPSASAFYIFVEHIGWSSYTVAWANENADANRWGNMMLNAVVDNLNTEADLYGDGTDYNLLPVGASGNVNVPYASTFGWGNDSEDTEILLQSLSEGGNFFYVGHGNPNRITPVPYNWFTQNITHNYGYGINAGDVAFQLDNSVRAHYIAHPYRLVILNSCACYSKAWANAFGFAFQPLGSSYTVNDYASFHREPQAFVAWDTDVGAPDNTDADSIQKYQNCLEVLMEDWQEGYPIKDCMPDYAAILYDNGFFGGKNYKICGCVDLNNSFR